MIQELVVRAEQVFQELEALPDQEVTRLATVAEQCGRMIDSLRLLVAGEIGARSNPELGTASLSPRLGCCNPGELVARLTRVSRMTSVARIRDA